MSLKQSESFSERVLRDMSSAVLVLDVQGNIVYVNRPASIMLEVEQDIAPGVRFALYSEEPYNDDFHGAVLNSLYQKHSTTVDQVPFRAPSGKEYIFLLSSSFLQGESEADDKLVVTLADETEKEQVKQKLYDSSKTFSTFLYGFCLWMLFYAFWEFLKRPFPADYMTFGVEVLGLVMLLYILYYTSLTWHDLGVMPARPLETMKTSLIVALGAVAFLFVLKMVARLVDPNCFEPDAPFFDISRFGLRQVLYLLRAGIQEFLARSVIQGNLKRIMEGKHTGLRSIVLSSLIFAGLHIHFGFLFMAGAAVLAGLEGILYDKQQNIFGVWIVHWAFGVTGTLLCLIDH